MDGEPAVTDDYGQPYGQPSVQPYGQPYVQQPYGQPVPAPRTNGFAIAALACGIGGFVVFPASIAAIVLGHIARREIRQTGEAGSGMATAGLVLGYIGTAILALLVVAFIGAFVFLASVHTGP